MESKKPRVRISRTRYIQYLDENMPYHNSEMWIIGGKMRKSVSYGKALRIYDPIAFEVGFQEWARNF